jgi:hypothetical protein
MAADAHAACVREPFEVLRVRRTMAHHHVPSAWTRALLDVDRQCVQATTFVPAGGFYFLTRSSSGRADANHVVRPGAGAFFDFATHDESGAFVSRFVARFDGVAVVRHTTPRADTDNDEDDDAPVVITLIDTVVFAATPTPDVLRETELRFVYCYGAPANYQCEVRAG